MEAAIIAFIVVFLVWRLWRFRLSIGEWIKSERELASAESLGTEHGEAVGRLGPRKLLSACVMVASCCALAAYGALTLAKNHVSLSLDLALGLILLAAAAGVAAVLRWQLGQARKHLRLLEEENRKLQAMTARIRKDTNQLDVIGREIEALNKETDKLLAQQHEELR